IGRAGVAVTGPGVVVRRRIDLQVESASVRVRNDVLDQLYLRQPAVGDRAGHLLAIGERVRGQARGAGVAALRVVAADRLVVVGQVGGGAVRQLADRVAAGADVLEAAAAGGRAEADAAVVVGGAVDLQINAAGAVTNERLQHL